MSDDAPRAEPPAPATTLTVVLKGTATVVPCRARETIVAAARRAGLRPPVSCLQGACGTCMARIREGAVAMRWNEVLTPAEIAAGYVLTCQGVPTTSAVTVVYED